MEKISNYNCKEMCIEKTCSERYTRFTIKKIGDMEIMLSFCDNHAEKYEKNYMKLNHNHRNKLGGKNDKIL